MGPEVSALQTIAETLAGPVGTFFIVVLIFYALATKRIVPGWVYQECVEEGKVLRADIATRVAKTEAEIDVLRRERMGTRGD